MKTKYVLEPTDIKAAIAEWVATHHVNKGPIPTNAVRLNASKNEDDRGFTTGYDITAEVEV
ncbi:hypothetical protein EVC29_113 [Rhizobium phage RHph_Y52]|nr:hypothetical protein EVC03_116 [Rhizobium phage RHph_Y5A]QIG75342.1 hypothetical protein EVC16_113 [Rhizobium phage RHph_Y21]QIG75558.1 hypothetical protein EVC18_116 [Rhizobium phage RHph_Y2_4]QIG76814.1 hypothetical protein EVC29_113 [Rhizobium phage RHph_Y52]